MQLGKVLRDAPHPAVLHIGIGHPDIEGIVAHRDRGAFDLGMSQRIVPVIDTVDLDPLARLHGRRAFARARTGGHQKRVIILDMAMLPFPPKHQPHLEDFTWALPQGGMHGLVIDLIRPLTEEVIQIPKRPDRVSLRVHRCGEESRLFAGLSITQEGVDELGVGGPKKPLHDRAKPRLRPRARLLCAVVASQEALKIDTVKFFAPIDY